MAERTLIGVELTSSSVAAALVSAGPAADSAVGQRPVAWEVLRSVSLDRPAEDESRLQDVLVELAAQDARSGDATSVAIATTSFEDALGSGESLARTGCLRLVASAVPDLGGDDGADSVRVLAAWPEAAREAVIGLHRTLPGGCEFDGRRIGRPSRELLAEVAAALLAARVGSVAISGSFASVDPRAESEVADELRGLLPGLPVSLSQPLGSIGLLARENAAVINAALLPLAHRLTRALHDAVVAALPSAQAYLTRLDGSLMALPYAARLPALTLGAVPAARVRGAARRAGHHECVVAIADPATGREHSVVVRAGEPVLSAQGQDVLGAGTSLPALELGQGTPSAPELPLVREDRGSAGGAVGAAGDRVVEFVDRIVAAGPSRDPAVRHRAGEDARQLAVLAGAIAESVALAGVSESPLAYMPGDFVRLRVTATGLVP